MYKPCTAAQFRVLEFLRETFDTSLCLIYPASPDALVLEDQLGGRLEFALLDGKVVERPLTPLAGPDDVWLFRESLMYHVPDRNRWTFSVRNALWSSGAFRLSYQQARDLPDGLFRHFLRTPMLTAEVQRLSKKGTVSEDDFRSIQLWRLAGHTGESALCGPWEDSVGAYVCFCLRAPGFTWEDLPFYVT